jgi:uncharacterized membrane protein YkvI
MRVASPSLFQRLLLPGFAFKAVVIGGGYATGRELAEFFLPAGPWGGVLGMVLAMLTWSVVCAVTFLFARGTRSLNYGAFFASLLGPGALFFDAAYCAMLLLVLSVFGAAAGAIGAALFGWPPVAGTLCLAAGIAGVAAFGNESVERLFKYVTFFLYGVYALFLVLSLTLSHERIAMSFAASTVAAGWAKGGATYAGYNLMGAVVILPVLRHLTSARDALTAGLLCGPLGMLPALVFFVCMAAYYPDIGAATLPSDYMLTRLGVPGMQLVFQLMIFAALLESGTGSVHAVNERLAGLIGTTGRRMTPTVRFAVSAALLVIAIYVATRFGLVALIANGYRLLSYLVLTVYVVPLMTVGLWRVLRGSREVAAA